MKDKKEKLIEAIRSKHLVEIVFNTEAKGIIKRICIPFDFGTGKIDNHESERFHFYDLDSPDGSHNLSILPEELNSLKIIEKEFNPADYVKWTPNWHITRDWGIYS